MTMTYDGTNGITFPDSSQQKTAGYSPFRNRIINGDMRIDQRNNGSAQTITAGSTVYTIDRWIGYFGGGNGTAQRVGSAGAYSLQFTGGAGVSGFQTIQRIESNNIADLAGQTVTLSFTVSSSNQTAVGLFYNIPTAQDNFVSLNTTGTINGSVPLTTTPTRLSYTFTLPSTATNGFQFFFQLGSFTSGTFTVTNVQLEKGSVATPFEYRPYGTELALCQRYCYKAGAENSNSYKVFGFGYFWSATEAQIGVPLPVTMRAYPSLSSSGGFYLQASGGGQTPTTITLQTISRNYASVGVSGFSGASIGQGCKLLDDAGVNATSITFSAEL